ncbi:MAG: HD domain-containing protein [Spirochaetaceae bacterium]|jgi:poly(A) polymerase|nr:HD domain-containing protein [Spirochaetaceae bacterium]
MENVEKKKSWPDEPVRALAQSYAAVLCGFSAIDRYVGLPDLPVMRLETDADLAALARTFDVPRFPGNADAAFDFQGKTWYFRCRDPDETPPAPSYRILSFSQDGRTGRFLDPCGVYPILREFRASRNAQAKSGKDRSAKSAEAVPEPWWYGRGSRAGAYQAVSDAALILARYGNPSEAQRREVARTLDMRAFSYAPAEPAPNHEAQRGLLSCLLVSARPDWGLELLWERGFIDELWPELGLLNTTDQAKEFHPEGNVWHHTLATFQYRKTFDLRLSLGLLLHDLGKPRARASGPYRFNRHAEIGAEQARNFLERLGFDRALIQEVCFLVRHHMIPAALTRLPLSRTQAILDSPLFPALLELYRCDEASSFKSFDGYYKASAAYRAYLKHRSRAAPALPTPKP